MKRILDWMEKNGVKSIRTASIGGSATWGMRWPSALPYYIAAHEISFTGSIIGAIVAEWMFPKRGLGFLLSRGILQIRADKVYAVTIISSVLAIGAFFLVKWAEKRLFRWKGEINI